MGDAESPFGHGVVRVRAEETTPEASMRKAVGRALGKSARQRANDILCAWIATWPEKGETDRPAWTLNLDRLRDAIAAALDEVAP